MNSMSQDQDGIIILSQDEEDALQRAHDVYAAIEARKKSLLSIGCTRVYLQHPSIHDPLYSNELLCGPIGDFITLPTKKE